MPEVDVCWKVQFADDDVPVGFVLETACQRGQSRANVRNTSDLFETCSDHFRKQSARFDDDRQPFLPVLAIVAPVCEIFVDSADDIDRRGTRPGVVEVCSARGYWDFLSDKVNIQGKQRPVIIRVLFSEYKGSASKSGKLQRRPPRCSSCTRTDSSQDYTAHRSRSPHFRNDRIVGS